MYIYLHLHEQTILQKTFKKQNSNVRLDTVYTKSETHH